MGWGAEVIAQTAEALGPSLKAARRSAALDLPIPASSALEVYVLPGVDTIMQAALGYVGKASKMTNPIYIPLLNSNEPEALLSEIYIAEGQFVRKGDLLCSLETTKSSADVTAEQDGYVTGLRLEKGQTARAGELLCYLAPTSHWESPVVEEEGTAKVPEGMRITRPALEMARRLHLDLSALPSGSLITEAVVRAFASQRDPEKATQQVSSMS
jgi:pyruvate/2-oxoglutarate dehydrogenase complex dihydrolipoamide acyltransferase (E2) component